MQAEQEGSGLDAVYVVVVHLVVPDISVGIHERIDDALQVAVILFIPRLEPDFLDSFQENAGFISPAYIRVPV